MVLHLLCSMHLEIHLKKILEKTKKVVELTAKYGATVEAELGLVGGSEDGKSDHGSAVQTQKMQRFFVKKQELMHWQ